MPKETSAVEPSSGIEDILRLLREVPRETSGEGVLRRYEEELQHEGRSRRDPYGYVTDRSHREVVYLPAEEVRRFLLADESGRELTQAESLGKQRELLSTIAQELVGQREDARRGEADALAHQRRALRIAAWSLGVAALALLPPIVEIVLKLLGVDL